jgi:hypothetical protein
MQKESSPAAHFAKFALSFWRVCSIFAVFFLVLCNSKCGDENQEEEEEEANWRNQLQQQSKAKQSKAVFPYLQFFLRVLQQQNVEKNAKKKMKKKKLTEAINCNKLTAGCLC